MSTLVFLNFLSSGSWLIPSLRSDTFAVSYDALNRECNHSWTLEDKVVLMILVKMYKNGWDEKTRVFNGLLFDDPNSPKKFSEGAIRSMFSGIKTQFDKSFGDWATMRSMIETTACSLGVNLVLNLCNEGSTAIVPEVPVLPPQSLKVDNTEIYSPQVPRIAFRAYSVSSQGFNSAIEFQSGLSVNCNNTAPPEPSSLLYRHHARRHIARVHEGTTPFISVTRNLIRALHHAFKTEKISSIAVIDLWKAGYVDQYDYQSNPYIQEVRSLKLNPGDPYSGKGEYLIWGKVNYCDL